MSLESKNKSDTLIRKKFSQFEAETELSDWSSMKDLISENKESESLSQNGNSNKKKFLLFLLFLFALFLGAIPFLMNSIDNDESKSFTNVQIQKKSDLIKGDLKKEITNSNIVIERSLEAADIDSNALNESKLTKINDAVLSQNNFANSSKNFNNSNSNTLYIGTPKDKINKRVYSNNERNDYSKKSIIRINNNEVNKLNGEIYNSNNTDFKPNVITDPLEKGTENVSLKNKNFKSNIDTKLNTIDLHKLSISSLNNEAKFMDDPIGDLKELPIPILSNSNFEKHLRVNLVGGLRYNQLTNATLTESSFYTNISDVLVTFTGGVNIEYQYRKNISFSLGLSRNRIRTSEIIHLSDIYSINTASNSTLDWQYRRVINHIEGIEIPLGITYKPFLNGTFLNNISFNAGVVPSYLFVMNSKSREIKQSLGQLTAIAPEGWNAPSFNKGIKNLDFGLSLGSTYQLTNQYSIEGKIQVGLRDITDDAFWNSNSQFDRNSSVQLRIGYNIFNRKL